MILVMKQSHHGSTEFTPAMARGTSVLPGLSPVARKPVHSAFDGGLLPSPAAGILLLAEIHRRLWICEGVAHCIENPRPADRCGYADANDYDVLRTDPASKIAAG